MPLSSQEQCPHNNEKYAYHIGNYLGEYKYTDAEGDSQYGNYMAKSYHNTPLFTEINLLYHEVKENVGRT